MFQTRKKILAIIVLLLAATVVLAGCKEKAEPKPSESPSPSPTATTAPSASPSATPKATTAPSASPSAAPKSTTAPSANPSAAPKSTTAPDANPASASTATTASDANQASAPTVTTAPNANPATVTNVETNKQSGTSSNVQQKIESEAEVYNEPETVQTTSGPVGTNQGSTAVPAEEIIIEEIVDQAPSSTPAPASTSTPAPTSTSTPTSTLTPTPTPHVHTPVTDPAIEATCIHSGLSVGSHCSECGAILQAQEVIPKMPHMYLNGACVWCGARDPNAGNGYIIELPIL